MLEGPLQVVQDRQPAARGRPAPALGPGPGPGRTACGSCPARRRYAASGLRGRRSVPRCPPRALGGVGLGGLLLGHGDQCAVNSASITSSASSTPSQRRTQRSRSRKRRTGRMHQRLSQLVQLAGEGAQPVDRACSSSAGARVLDQHLGAGASCSAPASPALPGGARPGRPRSPARCGRRPARAGPRPRRGAPRRP